MTAVLALLVGVIVAAGGAAALAWWIGYGQGFRAAMAYRKITTDVEAGTLAVEDSVEGDAA